MRGLVVRAASGGGAGGRKECGGHCWVAFWVVSVETEVVEGLLVREGGAGMVVSVVVDLGDAVGFAGLGVEKGGWAVGSRMRQGEAESGEVCAQVGKE